MKIQIKKELHAKTASELRKQLVAAHEEQRTMRLDQEMGKLKNTSSLTSKRVEIAVISTILNEKLAEEPVAKEVKKDEKKETKVKDKPAAATKSKVENKADKEGGKKA